MVHKGGQGRFFQFPRRRKKEGRKEGRKKKKKLV